MTIRHAALAAGAALVLGLTVYLFVQVRSRPAAAEVPQPVAHPAIDLETDDRPRTPPPRPVKIPPPLPAPAPADAAVASAEVPSKPSFGELVRQGPDAKQGTFADPKLMAVMDEANRAYDHGDLDDARTIAQKVLAQSPGNPRMLRIVVSAACISGDAADAQKAYIQLSPVDREAMKVRCARYGMAFKDE